MCNKIKRYFRRNYLLYVLTEIAFRREKATTPDNGRIQLWNAKTYLTTLAPKS